ncbi:MULTISPECIES: amidohydrolase [unclassified Clostridium]|uniref:amidohydrolase n=1 Tax=unclassified Clostridium TaxID=2614128 RepID=UPI00207ABE80|nr:MULTISPECIES: amidohydrolase [unclassified Clostridium]
MINDKLLEKIDNLEEELINLYHILHQNPELSNEEFETTNMIKKLLQEVDIDILHTDLKTGLIAEVKGNPNGPIVAIRCDIDALPIKEESVLSYKSKNNGKMHACGHDFHMAAILGAAYLIKKSQRDLIGTVKFIFEPSEESSKGAKKIIDTGALDDVEAIFGLHNVPNLDVGIIGIKSGAMTAAVDRFEIKISGIGSHAAKPEKSIDPIIISSNIINALQTIISRNVSPINDALLSITHIESGNSWNIIPDYAYMEGTVRTLDKETRELIPKRMSSLINGIAESFGGKAEFIWHEGHPATNNEKEWVNIASQIGKRMGYKVSENSMGLEGEDFAYYQETIPGAFIIFGTGKSFAHHHPKFAVDENAIINCAKYFANLSEEALSILVKKRHKL